MLTPSRASATAAAAPIPIDAPVISAVLFLSSSFMWTFYDRAMLIQQDQLYHAFADQRTLLGIPHFWNVVSNLPFAVVGVMGLLKFRDVASRTLFFGVLLVTFGSAYYHLAPDDARLVWDRLPMTVAFMALLAIALRLRTWGLMALVAFGIASVGWWKFTG